jgi:hypothetical protein
VAGTIGIGVLFVVGVALTLGLIVRGVRHRDVPALLVASTLIFLGPLAVSCARMAIRLAHEAPALSKQLAIAAAVTSSLGVASSALVTAFVFRRGSRIGWLATALLVTAMFACVIGAATADGGMDLRHTPSGFRLAYQMLQLGTILWAAVEAFATWSFLRRRVRLGIGNALVVNRIALWSLASLAASIGMAISFFSAFLGLRYAGDVVEIPVAVLGLVAATALWLSFVPPARYRAWIERRSPASVAEAERAPLAPHWPLG